MNFMAMAALRPAHRKAGRPETLRRYHADATKKGRDVILVNHIYVLYMRFVHYVNHTLGGAMNAVVSEAARTFAQCLTASCPKAAVSPITFAKLILLLEAVYTDSVAAVTAELDRLRRSVTHG